MKVAVLGSKPRLDPAIASHRSALSRLMKDERGRQHRETGHAQREPRESKRLEPLGSCDGIHDHDYQNEKEGTHTQPECSPDLGRGVRHGRRQDLPSGPLQRFPRGDLILLIGHAT